MARRRALALALALACACVGRAGGLHVVVEGTSHDVLSPLLNEFFGAQIKEANITDVAVAWRNHRTPSDAMNCTEYEGKVVFTHVADDSWSWTDEHDASVRLEACGAVLLVKATDPPLEATEDYIGFSYHTRDSECCRGVDEPSLAVVSVWYDTVRFVETAVAGGQLVTLTLHDIEPNPWDERVFHQAFFIVLMRVLLSACNFLVFCLAIRALAHRSHCSPKRLALPTSLAFECPKLRVAHLINLALAADAIACLLRGVYCATGPIFSNGFYTTTSHMFLLNISFPIEVAVLSATILTFRKLGSLTEQSWVQTKRRMVPVWILAALSFVSEMVASYFRSKRKDLGLLVMVSSGSYLLFIVVVATMFVVVGRSFLRQLHAMENASASGAPQAKHHTANRRLKRRFTLWVLCDSVPLFGQIVLFAFVVVTPRQFYTAEGLFAGYFCAFSCFTLCSLCQVLAFSPHKLNRVGDNPQESVTHTTMGGASVGPRPVVRAEYCD